MHKKEEITNKAQSVLKNLLGCRPLNFTLRKDGRDKYGNDIYVIGFQVVQKRGNKEINQVYKNYVVDVGADLEKYIFYKLTELLKYLERYLQYKIVAYIKPVGFGEPIECRNYKLTKNFRIEPLDYKVRRSA
jgi:hypothetical protein